MFPGGPEPFCLFCAKKAEVLRQHFRAGEEKMSGLLPWCPSLGDTTVVFIHHVGRLIFEGLALSRIFCWFCRMLLGFILCFFQLIFLLYLAFIWQWETQGYKLCGITAFISTCDAEWRPHFSALMVAVFRLAILHPADVRCIILTDKSCSWDCSAPPSSARSLPQDYPVFTSILYCALLLLWFKIYHLSWPCKGFSLSPQIDLAGLLCLLKWK